MMIDADKAHKQGGIGGDTMIIEAVIFDFRITVVAYEDTQSSA
jgi:hypothetical protein